MDRLRIEVPCQLQYRDAAGALIAQVCERLEQQGADRGFRHQVLSAFNEAFNNLALHAAERSDVVRILLELDPKALHIEIRDRGTPFEFREASCLDLDELPESGLGLFIMRSFMSRLEYRPGQGGEENVLRMVRSLRGGIP